MSQVGEFRLMEFRICFTLAVEALYLHGRIQIRSLNPLTQHAITLLILLTRLVLHQPAFHYFLTYSVITFA